MSTVDLRLGDCLELMRDIPSGSVDAVITDPPYPNLVGGYDLSALENPNWVGKARNRMITVGNKWEATLEWVAEAKRIAIYGAIVFCSHHSIPEIALAFNDWRRVMLLTWYKRNAPPTGKNVPRFTCEYAWCFAKRPGIKWDEFNSTMIEMPRLTAGCMASAERVVIGPTKQAAHPTQKPVALMEKMLAGGINSVFDPFMGSGTTGVACVKLNRNFIGMEIDPTYFAIAQKRIADAQQQTVMAL